VVSSKNHEDNIIEKVGEVVTMEACGFHIPPLQEGELEVQEA
jgi:hypothetical protein